MTKHSDNINHAENGQPDAVTMGLASYTTIFQAIVAEGADYTKKTVETLLALVEKLVGAKSLDTVVQIQSEYAKTRRTPPSSRTRLKWANSIPTSPRQRASPLKCRSPTC